MTPSASSVPLSPFPLYTIFSPSTPLLGRPLFLPSISSSYLTKRLTGYYSAVPVSTFDGVLMIWKIFMAALVAFLISGPIEMD